MRDKGFGYAMAATAAAISGLSIYVNSLGVRLVPDSTAYTSLKNAVAGVLLLLPCVAAARYRREASRLRGPKVGLLVALAVIGGSVPYVLFFRGLQLTTASTGSLLNHAQFLFVAAIAGVVLGERLRPVAWLGLALLTIGVALGADLRLLKWNEGALLILLSSVLFAGGLVLTRALLASVSAPVVMAFKISLGAVLLLGYAAASGHLAAAGRFPPAAWAFILGTGVILTAFTVATTLALQRVTAVAVAVIGMSAPLVTIGLQSLHAGRPVVTPVDLAALGLTLAGAAVVAALTRPSGRARSGLALAA